MVLNYIYLVHNPSFPIEKLIYYEKMGQIKSGRSYIKLDGLQPQNGGNLSLKKLSKTVFPEIFIGT